MEYNRNTALPLDNGPMGTLQICPLSRGTIIVKKLFGIHYFLILLGFECFFLFSWHDKLLLLICTRDKDSMIVD